MHISVMHPGRYKYLNYPARYEYLIYPVRYEYLMIQGVPKKLELAKVKF